MNRPLLIVLLLLICSHLSFCQPEEAAQWKHERNVGFEEVASKAVMGKVEDRLKAIATLELAPANARRIPLLLYLLQDSSIEIRRASALAMGRTANSPLAPGLARQVCETLDSEIASTAKKSDQGKDEDLLLVAAYAFALHEFYVFHPTISVLDFRIFEESYISTIKSIGLKLANGGDWSTVFEALVMSIGSVEGTAQLLPVITEIINSLPSDYACVVVLVLQERFAGVSSDIVRRFYREWLRSNGQLFDALAAKAAKPDNPEHTEINKKAADYIRNEIFPITHQK